MESPKSILLHVQYYDAPPSAKTDLVASAWAAPAVLQQFGDSPRMNVQVAAVAARLPWYMHLQLQAWPVLPVGCLDTTLLLPSGLRVLENAPDEGRVVQLTPKFVPPTRTDWTAIADLHQLRICMEHLHSRVQRLPQADFLTCRPELFNLLYCGVPGSGRFTLAGAFCDQFGYCLYEVDLLDHLGLPIHESRTHWAQLLAGVALDGPAMLYLRNFHHATDAQQRKFIALLDGLPPNCPLLCVIATEPQFPVLPLLQHFKVLDFPSALPRRGRMQLFARNNFPQPAAWSSQSIHPAGQSQRAIEETMLLALA